MDLNEAFADQVVFRNDSSLNCLALKLMSVKKKTVVSCKFKENYDNPLSKLRMA